MEWQTYHSFTPSTNLREIIVSSINSISSYVQPLTSTKACQDDYTINANLYGPAVASVIGVANAAADSVSAICSFSAESLEKLGDMADAGYDAVESAIDSVTNGFTQLYTDVAAMASDGLDTLGEVGQSVSHAAEDVVDSIEDGLSDAATAVSDAASSVVDGISTAAGNVADFVSLGVTAGTLS